MPLGLLPNQSAPEDTVNRLMLGRLTLTLSVDVTLDDTQAGHRFLDFQGTPGAAVAVTVPDTPKAWIVRNTSGQTVTLKTAAGSGVAITDGSNAHLYTDGVEVYAVVAAGVPQVPSGGQAYKDVADLLAFDHHWRMDETSGTLAADSTGSLNGTITGGITLGLVDTPIHESGEKAMTYDGVDGNIAIPVTLNNPTQRTMAIWVRPDAALSAEGVTFSTRSQASQLLNLNITAAGEPRLLLQDSTPTLIILADTGNDVRGQWVLLVGVLDTVADNHSLYVNGQLVLSDATNFAGNFDTNQFNIGAQNGTTGFVNYFNGDAAEAASKDGVLTAAQIRALYQAGISFTAATSLSKSPVLYLRLQDLSGSLAIDHSFNGTDGTYAGGVILGVADSPITNETAPTSVSFDGVDDVVTTPYAGVLGTNEFNVRGWVKTSAAGIQMLCSWGTAAAGQQVEISISAAGLLVADFSGASVTGTAVINDGVWHQFAVDAPATPTVADVVLFIDGVADTISNTVNGAQALNLTSGANVAIGRDIAGTGFGQFLMAEFAIDPV